MTVLWLVAGYCLSVHYRILEGLAGGGTSTMIGDNQ